MVLAEADFALETRILPETITRLAFVIFRLEYLAGRLVFKLIIFAEKRAAKGATKYPAAVVPDAALTFRTDCVRQWTSACVRGETTSAVTDPRLAIVTYRPLR